MFVCESVNSYIVSTLTLLRVSLTFSVMFYTWEKMRSSSEAAMNYVTRTQRNGEKEREREKMKKSTSQ